LWKVAEKLSGVSDGVVARLRGRARYRRISETGSEHRRLSTDDDVDTDRRNIFAVVKTCGIPEQL